jgi:hypothetical protein
MVTKTGEYGEEDIMAHIKRAVLVVLVCTFSLNGCTAWKVVDPPALEDEDERKDVRVHLEKGTVVELKAAYAGSDSLFGLGMRRGEVGWRGREGTIWDVPTSIALKNVASVESRQSDSNRTIMLIGGLVVGAGMVVGLVLYSASQAGR